MLFWWVWDHFWDFRLRVAPLTFGVPDIYQAWNQNLIKKYGPSNQILFYDKNRLIYQKLEKLQFWVKTLCKRPTKQISTLKCMFTWCLHNLCYNSHLFDLSCCIMTMQEADLWHKEIFQGLVVLKNGFLLQLSINLCSTRW